LKNLTAPTKISTAAKVVTKTVGVKTPAEGNPALPEAESVPVSANAIVWKLRVKESPKTRE